MAAPHVLIAEDDAPIRDLLDHHFTRDGFRCTHAADGVTALRAARDHADAVILDLGLPAADGLDILRTLRRERRATPVLVLTARVDEIDRVIGLELGADDYVCKPFSPREVVARVRGLLRRAGAAPERGPSVMRCGRLEVDEGAREARIDGCDLKLKPREFSLLFELMQNPGIALSRSTLLERVWGYDFVGDDRTIDVHVRRLRMRIQAHAGMPNVVRTVHGFGYKFVAE